MKTLSHFVGTTILGGVLFLTPIVVLAFVLSKVFDFSSHGISILGPVPSGLPQPKFPEPAGVCSPGQTKALSSSI